MQRRNCGRVMCALAAVVSWAFSAETPAQTIGSPWPRPGSACPASNSALGSLPPEGPAYAGGQPQYVASAQAPPTAPTGYHLPTLGPNADSASFLADEQLVQTIVDERFKSLKDKELGAFKGLKGVTIGMTGYLDYSFGEAPEFNFQDTNYNVFRVTRGYLTVKKEITPWFHARVTPDAHQDSTGDWKVRLKYYYAELRPQDFIFLTNMQSEIGLGHMPWLDFEEHVNPYRCQGTMPIERVGVFNSADLGISLRGNLGGKLPFADQRIGNHYYDGRYGSWHLGVYNGSGYHAPERNDNKAVEGRLTIRPLPEVLPGLQLSYFGIHGEGNTNSAAGWPDYNVNMAMLSYQNPWLIVVAQYFTTRGNAAGTWVDAQGTALDTEGYSVFGDIRLPIGCERRWSLMGRYDHFNQDVDGRLATDAYYDMAIGGLVYHFHEHNLIMVVYEATDYGSGAGKKGRAPDPANANLGNDQKGQVVLQVEF